MAGLQRRARTRLNLLGQYAWIYRITSFGVAVAGYGVVSVVWDMPIVANAVAGAIGAALSVIEVRALNGRERAVIFTRRDGDDYADVLSRLDSESRPVTSAADAGFLLKNVSRTLRSSPIAATVDRLPYERRAQLDKYSLSFLGHRIRESTMFNGKVVGLANDLPATVDESTTPPVVLRRCGYFDFVCTNLLAPFDVYETGRGLVQDGRQLFLHHNRVRSLSSSWLANVIGVSTLAFCTDGKLLLVNQSRENVGSPELLAPSGSGSLEQIDLNEAGSLQQIIIRGMVRELREECRVRIGEVEATALTGYGRWLTRGAVPEFTAVTLLTNDSFTISMREVTGTEKVYVAGVLPVRLEPLDLWTADRPAEMLPAEYRRAASFPLLLALAALAEYLETDTPLVAKLKHLLLQSAA